MPGIDVEAAVSRQWGTAGSPCCNSSRPRDSSEPRSSWRWAPTGPSRDADFDDMMSVLQGASRVVFVNVHVDRPWQDPNNAVLAQGAARYPRVVIADWATLAAQIRRGSAPTAHTWPSTAPEPTQLAALITSTLSGRLTTAARVRPDGCPDFPRDGARRRRSALADAGRAAAHHTRAISSSAAVDSARPWWHWRSASGRPTVWATGQYLSYAPTHSVVEWEVTLAVVGGHVTQGRAVGRVSEVGRSSPSTPPSEGTSSTSTASGSNPPSSHRPKSARPVTCPRSSATPSSTAIEVRIAKGRMFDDMDGEPGSPDSALWARVPGHLAPSAATLAIFGDYVSGGVSQPLGGGPWGAALTTHCGSPSSSRPSGCSATSACTRSIGGYAQGVAFLWSEEGDLLATASQSLAVRLWPGRRASLRRECPKCRGVASISLWGYSSVG